MRVCFYTLSVVMEKESAQKRGIVLIGNFQVTVNMRIVNCEGSKVDALTLRYLPLTAQTTLFLEY